MDGWWLGVDYTLKSNFFLCYRQNLNIHFKEGTLYCVNLFKILTT